MFNVSIEHQESDKNCQNLQQQKKAMAEGRSPQQSLF